MAGLETIGGDGPNTRLLYHYSQTEVTQPIRPWQYWTEFKSDDPADVSRFTGTEVARLRYRSEARVNEAVIDGDDPWFTNQATKFVQGLGAYDEYVNRKPVHPKFLETVAL